MVNRSYYLTRTPLLLDEGMFSRVKALGRQIGKKSKRAYDVVRRARTPEFVRHCVTAISQDPGKVAQIKRKGTVHGICQATYDSNVSELSRRHPKGVHHTADEYHDAADKLGEALGVDYGSR